ncbi:MAG: glycoside hydrolase family 9 [Bacteroidetes bacterium]|nr:MAG: glycoside hydrolase family 9 [Bacteroidota bacterium]
MRNILLLFFLFPLCATSQEIHFRYNLTGYHPNDPKISLLMADHELDYRVDVIDAKTGETMYKGKLKSAKGTSWGQYAFQYSYDFTPISRPGEYKIKVGDIFSPVISIRVPDQKSWLSDALGFMRQQRCGYNPYFDIVCHQKDGRLFDGPVEDSTFYDFTGGWHDAGDQLKYLITSSNATARLLMSYELSPESFVDRFDAMGHPYPNGIPDILDEAKWGLDWLLKLHPKKDWLIHQIADDRDHRGFKFPDKDNAEYGWGPNSYRPAYFATGEPQGLGKWKSQATGISNIAGRSAAALALGARIWKRLGYDDGFALRCETAAKELFNMGKSREGYQQGNSYGAPYRYNENSWADDMEWAAAELYKLSGNENYLQEAIHYSSIIKDDGWMARDTMLHYELYPFMNLGHYSLFDVAPDSVKTQLTDWYKSNIEKVIECGKTNAFEIGVPFLWCSNNLMVN